MATATQRRAKAARRRAHAERRDHRLGMKFASPQDRSRYKDRGLGRTKAGHLVAVEDHTPEFAGLDAPSGEPTVDEASRFWKRNGSARAECPVCGKREKTTKAGKIGKHGYCTGQGKDPV